MSRRWPCPIPTHRTAVGAAVRLFAERAVAARPDFAIEDWSRESSEILAATGRHAAGIELAAARVRALTRPSWRPGSRSIPAADRR